MLMYATGTNAEPTNFYRWLRDHRLKGRTNGEAGEARRGSKPKPARAANVAAPRPGGLAVVQVPGGDFHVDRGLLGALGVSGGASEGSSSGRSELVSSLSEQLRLSFSLNGLSKSSAVANLVIGAAVNNKLPIYESMERAVAQYEAVGVDHLALRRAFINSLWKAQLSHRKWNLKRSSNRQIWRERRRTGRKKRGPRKSVNSGGNPGNWQMN
jgi:hypothetical protein